MMQGVIYVPAFARFKLSKFSIYVCVCACVYIGHACRDTRDIVSFTCISNRCLLWREFYIVERACHFSMLYIVLEYKNALGTFLFSVLINFHSHP